MPPIIKGLKPYQGRIARRVAALFLLCALVPLILCAVLLFRGFNTELSHTQTQSLDGLLRNFGMTLLGRLESAEDIVKVVMTESGRSSETARANIAKLPWARSVHKTESSDLLKRNLSLPRPDSNQERELQRGGTILLTDRDKNGVPTVYLVRAMPGGPWLYVQIDSGWLWADAAEFSGGASVLLLGAQGEVLGSIGEVPDELVRAAAFNVLKHVPANQSGSTSKTWVSRSWEIPLASRYSSPSWRLVAIRARPALDHSALYFYLCAAIAVAIVLAAWLSLVTIRRQLRPLELLAQATHQVSQQNFEAFRGMAWNDEFGDLARSFESMSQKLKTQFAALETFAEVDRLLLANPELKSILHTLLPRVPGLLACDAASVVLFDPEPTAEARAYAYEHYASQPDRREARSIISGIASLRSACNFPAVQVIHNGQQLYFSPDAPHPINTVRTFPLRNGGAGIGLFCLGYKGEMLDRPDSGVSAAEFADRLALILASLEQAQNMRQQAHRDSLTGPKNRHGFPRLEHREHQVAAGDLRRAFQRGAFTLHYQPILDGAPGSSVGVEALIRLSPSDEMAHISPAELISVAEETGLIMELGDWVLNTACARFAQWRREGLELGYVSVNISVRQLANPEFVTRLLGALQVNALRCEELQLEITESALGQDGALGPVLEEIVAHGIRLVLDDFGTGYSSLGHLRTYPIHTVKIDRSLVLNLPQDAAGCRLVESIIVMCDALDKSVVAEGVETEAQRDFLLAAGCGGIQGFLLGRPMEAAQIPRWLAGLSSRFMPPEPRKPWQIIVPGTQLKS